MGSKTDLLNKNRIVAWGDERNPNSFYAVINLLGFVPHTLTYGTPYGTKEYKKTEYQREHVNKIASSLHRRTFM